jgi:hypothetical protein
MECEDIDEDGQPYFVPMQSFYEQGYSIGALATIIETHGVRSEDRFGRRTLLVAAEATPALDALARRFAQLQAQPEPWEPSHDDPQGNPWFEYGWLSTELAALEEIERAEPPPSKNGGHAKGQNAFSAIVLAFLKFTEGTLHSQRHPDFSSRAKLIQHFIDSMGDYPGISKSNLEAVFARAQKLLK